MELLWFQDVAMSVTITLKNMLDDIYDGLKRATEAHHHSINS